MRNPVALVAVVLAAFALGWWMGGADAGLTARLDALETRVSELAEAPRAVAEAQPAAAGPTAPAERAEIPIDGAPVRGAEDAAITLVEYSDFQCPYCLRARPTIEKLRDEYGDKLRIVFKHFPLSFHDKAINAHRAALAAGKQGKFWEMHDLIFAQPNLLEEAAMRAHAEKLGLDLASFDADFASDDLGARIDADIEEGRRVGVRGTPAFFINGRLLSGAQPYDVFKRMIEEELSSAS